MKIRINPLFQRRSGFTLIEMIGVLAVIAILAAVLIPKVFEAINNSRVNNASMTCNTVKTAIADHYAKFGALTATTAGTIPAGAGGMSDFDKVLLTEGFLDKPFAVKIGNGVDANNSVRLATVDTAVTATTAPAIDNSVYDLDGNLSGTTGSNETPASSHVAEAMITAANLEDAQALDRLIDGATLSNSADATGNLTGRVKWAAATGTGATGYNIFVYLTHR